MHDGANGNAVASKFFEHFILISDAMTFRTEDQESSLWNEEDGYVFFLSSLSCKLATTNVG